MDLIRHLSNGNVVAFLNTAIPKGQSKTTLRIGFVRGKLITAFLVLLPLIGCGGGGGTSSTTTPASITTPPATTPPASTPPPAAPAILNIAPSTVMLGVPIGGFLVYGSGFSGGSQVMMDGMPLTTIVHPDYLLAGITLGTNVAVGVHQITVSSANQTSNAVPFTIYAPANGPTVFSAIRAYYATAGGDFGPVLVADVNGDHFADVIVNPFGSDGSVSVLHGNADGALSPPEPTGIKGGLVAVGDLEGTGAADLIVTDEATPFTIDVFKNDGTGQFTKIQNLPLPGGGPKARVVAVEDPRWPDLLIAAEDQSKAMNFIYFYRNTGGVLAPPVTLAAVSNTHFGVADVDGDGRPDIIYTAASDSSVHVLFNKGGGVFQDQVPAGLAGVTGQVTVADFNLDHQPDIAVESTSLSQPIQLSIYLNQGSGSFQLASQTTIAPAGFAPYDLVVGDFDQDGFPDMAGVNGEVEPGHILYLWGDGRGNFTSQQVVGPMGFTTAIGDINGDGIPDVVVPDRTNEVSVALGRHDRQFPSPVVLEPFLAGALAGSISAADVNKDGYADIFFTGDPRFGTPGSLFLNNHDGTFSGPIAEPSNGLLIADINGDGFADMVGLNGVNLVIWVGDGTGNFANAQIIAVPNPPGVMLGGQVAVADVDHDGHLDIVTGSAVFFGRGNFQFDVVPTLGGVAVIGDFAGNGFLDIATGNSGVLMQQPARVFRAAGDSNLPLAPSSGPLTAVGDFNGDGKDDIAVSTGGDSSMGLWVSRGDGTFYIGSSLSGGQSPAISALAIGNFGHNGKSDIVAGVFGPHQIALFTNVTDGIYQRTFYASGAIATNILAVDLNNDGKLDLVISNLELSYRPSTAVVIFGQ